jgi:hypothetical protein
MYIVCRARRAARARTHSICSPVKLLRLAGIVPLSRLLSRKLKRGARKWCIAAAVLKKCGTHIWVSESAPAKQDTP